MGFNIGINVLEVDGRATPSIQAAPTSVTGFSIRSQRGIPARVVRVTSRSQFQQHFGSYMRGAYGAYAVRGFFDNGGTTAYVTRVVNTEPGEATAASITSDPGPWRLEPGGKLTFVTDLPGSPLEVEFTASSAELVGGTGTFDLDPDDDGVGLEIAFIVNGVEQGPYTFEAVDFTDPDWRAATAEEVAQVLNREFLGIQAWVESDGTLRVRTDRRGKSATLDAGGDAEIELAFPLGEITGEIGSNVADIAAVTAPEAVALIDAVLSTAGLLVTQDGDRVKIEHPDVGPGHTMQVTDATAPSVREAFGFDNLVHEGAPGGTAVVAVASSRNFDAGSVPVLTVRAGHRGQEDPGAWGDELKILIEINEDDPTLRDLSVKRGDDVIETWQGLGADDTAQDYIETVINDQFSGSRYIVVQVSVANVPDATAGHTDADADDYVPLENGTDGTFSDRNAEINAFAASIDLFELHDIQLLCCPEEHDAAVVTKALTHCEQKNDRMFVGHTPENVEAGDIRSSYSNPFRGKKIYGALYFPWIQVNDPIGSTIWIPPTGHILGVYARTERERGIWKAPAGNAARLNGALDVKFHITDRDHTDLVKRASVNAVRFVNGQGIVIDSSRTLSTNTLWLYVNVRLLFNFVKSSLMSGLRWVVQEPNDDTLWNKVKYNSVTPFLMGLWRRGAFGPGAPEDVFTIKVDADNNPPANIQQGIFTVEVYFYPGRPAETIIITVGQQEGGATASEG